MFDFAALLLNRSSFIFQPLSHLFEPPSLHSSTLLGFSAGKTTFLLRFPDMGLNILLEGAYVPVENGEQPSVFIIVRTASNGN